MHHCVPSGKYFCFVQEKTCEESTSFDLTPYDVASAIAAVDRLLVDQVKQASFGETFTEEAIVDYSGWNLLFVLCFKA